MKEVVSANIQRPIHQNPRSWLLISILIVGGYGLFREYSYRTAVLTAEEEGFEWICENAFSLIGQDWNNAFRSETWRTNKRYLDVGVTPDLDSVIDIIQPLRPTWLRATGCEKVNALSMLTSLRTLQIENSPLLKNVGAIRELTRLQELAIFDCPNLQNLEDIKQLTGLRSLNLAGCRSLQNLAPLNQLTNLEGLNLSYCLGLEDVHTLKKLTRLQRLDLSNCEKISVSVLRDLRTSLPNTDITFPDGSKIPPK